MLKTEMLGTFRICSDQDQLHENEIHSKVMSRLLVYFVANRNKIISKEELIDVIWQNSEMDNPASALKTSIHRLRVLLSDHLGKRDYIITKSGGYQWNPLITMWVDVDEFHDLYIRSKDPAMGDERKMEILEQALEIYHGEFLNSNSDMHWVIVLQNYYHSILIKIVNELAELYLLYNRYEDLEQICTRELQFDYADEDLHYYLILSKIYSKKYRSALEAYENAKRIIREELGTNDSGRLESLQEKILWLRKKEASEDVSEVQQEIIEEHEVKGAFRCGYPVFREIYRLEARKLKRAEEGKFTRSQPMEYIMLFTVTTGRGTDVEGTSFEYRIDRAMQKLEEIIERYLRVGDVVAQYSDSQYIVLLMGCTQRDCESIADRIISRIDVKRLRVHIGYEYSPVGAADALANKQQNSEA